MKNLACLVLGGGKGTRLFPLTSVRSKPAVPLGGKYRLIDIPISNCIHSGINQIYLLTQFNSLSLHRHIRQTYSFDQFNGGFVEILAAQQTFDGSQWYQGTADAVRKNLDTVKPDGIDLVLILSGDQLYRMDYSAMIRTHLATGADATIAALPVTKEDAHGFGVMRLDASGKVEGFVEKPQTDVEMEPIRLGPSFFDERGIEPKGREYLASMGIYLFNKNFLVEALEKTDYQDFGKEVFPAAIRSKHVHVHLFDGYWEDIGTIRSFYQANLDMASENPPFELMADGNPIYTRPRYLPPTRLDGVHIKGSLIADGCVIGEGTKIENSIIGLRTRIGKNVHIKDSVLMGSDYTPGALDERDRAEGRPVAGFGNGVRIEGAIVDKNCRVGDGCVVAPFAGMNDEQEDGPVLIRDGIICVPKQTVLPSGWTFQSDHHATTLDSDPLDS